MTIDLYRAFCAINFGIALLLTSISPGSGGFNAGFGVYCAMKWFELLRNPRA